MNERPPPQQEEWPDGTIFTIGHSTLPIDRFVALLRAFGIGALADIRSVPRSRRNPQFNSDALAGTLKAADIRYVPLGALGGLRRAHKESPNTGWRNASFRGFADYMQTEAFARGLEQLTGLSKSARTAIMCAEAVPWRCHRSLVADALGVRGIAVIEILAEDNYRAHRLTPFAHVEGTTITYPPDQAALL